MLKDIIASVGDSFKHGTDAAAIGALVATLLNYLPAATAVLVFVWSALRIYETWLSARLKLRELQNSSTKP